MLIRYDRTFVIELRYTTMLAKHEIVRYDVSGSPKWEVCRYKSVIFIHSELSLGSNILQYTVVDLLLLIISSISTMPRSADPHRPTL